MSLDVMLTEVKECEIFSQNITHNLGAMAEEAGIYKHLWIPEEIGITTAIDLIQPLKEGVALMKKEPERFKKFNASNGWGMYEDFVPWIERYIEACELNPGSKVSVSR
jgi:hypothetical protein